MAVTTWSRSGISSSLTYCSPWRHRISVCLLNVFVADHKTLNSAESKSYTLTQTLEGHTDWVRDVAWSPSILSKSYIASASQDKTVRIWTADASNPTQWTSTVLEFDTVLWRVSWSLSGNILAVSGGDNKVSLWKENLKGQWEKVKDIEE